jgi:hypothetical protein
MQREQCLLPAQIDPVEERLRAVAESMPLG